MKNVQHTFLQREIDQVFKDGNSFYINESSWECIDAVDRAPRQCDVHCCQMSDGTILAFNDFIPEDADDFNQDWIVSLNPHTGQTLVDHDDQYSCDVLQILSESGIAIHADGKLKSN